MFIKILKGKYVTILLMGYAQKADLTLHTVVRNVFKCDSLKKQQDFVLAINRF